MKLLKRKRRNHLKKKKVINVLERVKLQLRILNTNALDPEVEDLIESARLDLIQSGIDSEKAKDDKDALIRRAIIFYAKANFGIDNPDAERYEKSYQMLKQHL